MRVRIYADRDYRAGVLHWRDKVRSQLERVNHVVEPVFNVRFEVESLREWDATHVGVGPARPCSRRSRRVDDARDVDWVVGLVTPFRGVATSIARDRASRGYAARSFVMRAMDDEEEGRALEREFAMLPEGERERLYADRKAHKESVMFLHEWAHTMGAAAPRASATMIMNRELRSEAGGVLRLREAARRSGPRRAPRGSRAALPREREAARARREGAAARRARTRTAP